MEKMRKFEQWLQRHGAEVLAPTNPWEVIRYKAKGETSIVYKNKFNQLTFTGNSQEAYDAFNNNRGWSAVNRQREALHQRKAQLAARDTRRCFACLKRLPLDELTIEHLLSFSHGGVDNNNNLCLMCEDCNKLMANLPIVKKIELIIQRRQGYGILDTIGEKEEFTILANPTTKRKQSNWFDKLRKKYL